MLFRVLLRMLAFGPTKVGRPRLKRARAFPWNIARISRIVKITAWENKSRRGGSVPRLSHSLPDRFEDQSGFHTFHTLPANSAPGLRVGLPGSQPEGVTSAPPVARTCW